jgi:hypothetical protein
MTSREFTQWISYAALEPFGFEIENWRAGMIASAIINAVYATVPRGKSTRRPKILTPGDFYPPTKPRPRPLTREQAEFIERKRKNAGGNRNNRLRGGNGQVQRRS